MPKKVLLVDTNFSSRPIYDAILNMGYEVHVVGGNPDDALAKTAEHYWELDYSNVDRLKELVGREGFDFIVPGCTDRSYSSCVMVSGGRFPGLEPPENDDFINLKDQFRKLATRLGIRVPEVFSGSEESLPYPLIVKPVDSYSGRGISVVKNDESLNEAITLARNESVRDKVIIEEYVEGQLYSHSAFIESGKVIQDFFVREDSIDNPFAVDLSMLCPDISLEPVSEMTLYIETVAEDLRLHDGLVHTQFIVGNEGCFIVEMTRRCPGDLYSRLIELQTGYAYSESYVSSFVGKKIERIVPSVESDRVIRHTVSSGNAKVFNEIKCIPDVDICEICQLYSRGEVINADHSKRVGIVFIKAVCGCDADTLYKRFLEREICQVL
jgi:predicted ATP-grasp superfamily ATP-dependent carboligase